METISKAFQSLDDILIESPVYLAEDDVPAAGTVMDLFVNGSAYNAVHDFDINGIKYSIYAEATHGGESCDATFGEFDPSNIDGAIVDLLDSERNFIGTISGATAETPLNDVESMASGMVGAGDGADESSEEEPGNDYHDDGVGDVPERDGLIPADEPEDVRISADAEGVPQISGDDDVLEINYKGKNIRISDSDEEKLTESAEGKALNEAGDADGVSAKELGAGLDDLPDEAKATLMDENGDLASRYDKALKLLSDDWEKEVLAKDFVSKTTGGKLDSGHLDNAGGILGHIFGELGFQKNENPFISFIQIAAGSGKQNALVTDEALTLINNLYADGTLDFNDIAGLGVDKDNHIIFDASVYSQPNPEFLIETYCDLSDISAFKRMNWKAIADSDSLGNDDPLKVLANRLSKEGLGAAQSVSQFRNPFMYKDGNGKSKMRTDSELRDLLMLAGSGQKSYDRGADKQSKEDTFVKELANLLKGKSGKEVQSMMNSFLNKARQLSMGAGYASAVKKESLEESKSFDLADKGDMEDAKAELDKNDDEGFEKIVDASAEAVDDLKKSYIGSMILRCPTCHTMVYKDAEDLVIDDDASTEDSVIYNTDDECPHCGAKDGYELIGQVASIDADGEPQDAPEAQSERSDEEVQSPDDVTAAEAEPAAVDDSADTGVEADGSDKPLPTPVGESLGNVTSPASEPAGYGISSVNETRMRRLIKNYLRETYCNVKDFYVSEAKPRDGKVIVEGTISFKSGKEKATRFEFEPIETTKSGKLKLSGMNESISDRKAFALTCSLDSGNLLGESMSYSYRIGGEPVRGRVSCPRKR